MCSFEAVWTGVPGGGGKGRFQQANHKAPFYATLEPIRADVLRMQERAWNP